MRIFATAAAIALASAAGPAAAEVVAASANGFHLRHAVSLPVPPERAWTLFGEVGLWWNKDHSYSGDSARLSLRLEPGGCFCERLDGGGVEHLRVTFADRPGRVVLTGGLGPLLYQATAGVMDVQFKRAGAGTDLVVDYKAAGFATGGGDKLAPLVDKVLAEQVGRFARHAGAAPAARR